MDRGYELYCLADPWFYDSPTLAREDDRDFAIAERPIPPGWARSELEDWLVHAPTDVDVPPQGWKVHASACLDNAEEILAAAWDYCIPRRIPFKFVRSRQLLLLCNAKYADRGSSGKFITMYPADETQLEALLTELGSVLEGQPGPYILSDLRWGAGPLYVRYGGFAERYCIGDDGQPELAVEEPGGRLVPDRRSPTFHIPEWVRLPEFLAPHLAARSGTTVQDIPYQIERALHFSNGGGLYAAVDRRSGQPVVLKEARPYAGLAVDGADAVARLRRERDMLERLRGLDAVPGVRDYFTLGDHHFLVLDLVDGTALSSLLVDRYPLTLLEADRRVVADYTSWALEVSEKLERAVASIHERDVVIGDLHPYNVLMRPDGRIVLIDMEVAMDKDDRRRPPLADPAFLSPRHLTGFDVDRYALACVRLFMFLPLTSLLGISRAKAEDFAEYIAEAFPVPRQWLRDAVGVITGKSAATDAAPRRSSRSRITFDPDAEGWRRARHSMAKAILSSATPDRKDRLFPGDVRQFQTGGLGIAYGAAGVLYALAETGAGRYPEHEEWLVQRATNPPPGTRLGFYDGLHGVAYVLDRLGRRDDALAVLDICSGELEGKWQHLGPDLFGGLAGVGLNLAHLAAVTKDASLRDRAGEVAAALADRLGDERDVPAISGGEHPHAGLLRGSSGPALLFLRMYERTGDRGWLDLAETALRQDLRRCLLRDDGALEVNEGWRTMPYLADGTVGIGLVLDRYLRHRRDDGLAQAMSAIDRAAEAKFYIEPGLFSGRAGMILYLSRNRRAGPGGPGPIVAGHVRRLAWHALRYRGGLAFPGEELLRLSMDLATGTAGVLLALGAALHHAPVHLPFIGRVDDERPLPSDGLVLTAEGR